MPVASGAAQWLRGLYADERRLVKCRDLPALVSGTSAPTPTLISRPGLFKLIARSAKTEAKAFDRWVRHEVLPQVMVNGGYVTADADMAKVAAAAPANTGLFVAQIPDHKAAARVRAEPGPEIEVCALYAYAHPIEVCDDSAMVQQAAQVRRVHVKCGPQFALRHAPYPTASGGFKKTNELPGLSLRFGNDSRRPCFEHAAGKRLQQKVGGSDVG